MSKRSASSRKWLRDHGGTDASITAADAHLDQISALLRNIAPLGMALQRASADENWDEVTRLGAILDSHLRPLTPFQLRTAFDMLLKQTALAVGIIAAHGLTDEFLKADQ